MLFNFHLYGFIVGVASVTGILLVEKKMEGLDQKLKNYYLDLALIFVFGLVGARGWHVATDYYLYAGNFFGIFEIWNGGLSILGAVLGGVMGAFFVARLEDFSLAKLLDLSVFGLPVAQSIGRWANYFNEELYGLPTNLPWRINIEGQGYHPLFLYESLLTLVFAIFIWFRMNEKRIGSGFVFWLYVFYYSVIRFFLDFLRPEKASLDFLDRQLGVNQSVLIIVILISGYILFTKQKLKDES